MARRKLRNLDNRILKKVVAHGAKLGIDEISTKTIAAEIGITEPTIYVHFSTRRNLLLEANSFAVRELALGFGSEDTTLLGRWEAALKTAAELKEDTIYAYFYRQENLSIELDSVLNLFLNEPTPLKVSVLEHFLYMAATGALEVNEANVKETFLLISKL